jgi:hypothetical protein
MYLARCGSWWLHCVMCMVLLAMLLLVTWVNDDLTFFVEKRYSLALGVEYILILFLTCLALLFILLIEYVSEKMCYINFVFVTNKTHVKIIQTEQICFSVAKFIIVSNITK